MTSSSWLRTIRRGAFIVLLILVAAIVRIPPATARQTGCGDVFRAALDTALRSCANLSLNQMCLGGRPASATAKASANIQFSEVGDKANVDDVASLALGGYNAADSSWGVVRLLLQANLPGNNPGAGVTMIVFGNVQVAAAPGAAGMQAFYLQTAGASSCENVPGDGVMIQSPRGQQKVQLVANGVQLSIGSTVFLNIETNEAGQSRLKVRTLEGQVTAQIEDQEVLIEAGEESGVEIVEGDEEFEFEPVGELEEDHPFDVEYVDDFPIELLPEELAWEELELEWEQADDQEGDEVIEDETETAPETDADEGEIPPDEGVEEGDPGSDDTGGESGDTGE